MSLTEKVDQSGTISEARVHADVDHWDRLEDWKIFVGIWKLWSTNY
jgi:hypothetical protein